MVSARLATEAKAALLRQHQDVQAGVMPPNSRKRE